MEQRKYYKINTKENISKVYQNTSKNINCKIP